MAERIGLSERELIEIERRYWTDTYEEIANDLGYSVNTIRRRAQNELGLPGKSDWNRLEYQHGVGMERILSHLHHGALMSVNEMSDALGVSRRTLDRWFSDTDVHKRGRSEAEKVKWQQMSKKEREAQVAAAHEKTREMAECGDHVFQQLWEERPEEMRKHVQEAAALGTEAREENGMAGVTGQDHPRWRGGKSIYDAVKKQLRPSFDAIKDEHREERCRLP